MIFLYDYSLAYFYVFCWKFNMLLVGSLSTNDTQFSVIVFTFAVYCFSWY